VVEMFCTTANPRCIGISYLAIVSVLESDFKSVNCEFEVDFRGEGATILQERVSETALETVEASAARTLDFICGGGWGGRIKSESWTVAVSKIVGKQPRASPNKW